MSFKEEIKIVGLKEIPIISKGDNIPKIIIDALKRNGLSLEDGDIIVIAQTIISRSNGRTRNLNEIIPSEKALELYKSFTQKAKDHGLPGKSPFITPIVGQLA